MGASRLTSNRRDLVYHNIYSKKHCCPIPTEAIILPWLNYHSLDGMAEVS
jgi:hypothetical protein